MNTLTDFIGRLVVRPDGEGEHSKLCIGAIKNFSLLKSGMVYDIVKCNLTDELKLVEAGPSAVKMTLPDYSDKGYNLGVGWAWEIGDLVNRAGGYLFMTEPECIELLNANENGI